MYLESLQLTNFKNLEEIDLQFSPGINCLFGANGSGKTNLLDSIYYLSFCKSFFNVVDSQNIRHNEAYFTIGGRYSKNGSDPYLLQIVQKRNQRKIFKVNKKEYEKLADHIGLFPLVMVSPYDRDLINEGSEVRRKFIDSIISQFDHLYLENLIDYNKSLQQRNSLLKQFQLTGKGDPVLLEMWDQSIVNLSEQIFPVRKSFVDAFIPYFVEFYSKISGAKELVGMKYESQLNFNRLDDLLKSSVHKDVVQGFTSYGIHKDEFLFDIDNYPVKKYGSQGQQKSFVIALRLAQYEYIRTIKDFKPVILFDDIFDKLDESRVSQIISLTGDDDFGQVFITDTDSARISKLFRNLKVDHKLFDVKGGSINESVTK